MMEEEQEDSVGDGSGQDAETANLLETHCRTPVPVVTTDDFSAADSCVNGSNTAANVQTERNSGEQQYDQSILYNLHPNYLQADKVEHPLEENVLLAFGRGVCFYSLGFLFGLPLIILLLVGLVVILPFRIVAYIVTRWTCRGLYRNVLSRRHCDPWWPLEPQRSTVTSPESSPSSTRVVEQCPLQCVATLQGSVSVDDLKQLMFRKLIRVEDSSGYLKYPKFTQILSSDCCHGLNRSWEQIEPFTLENHVIDLFNNGPQDQQTYRGVKNSGGKESGDVGGEGNNCAVWTLKELEVELNRLAVTKLDHHRPLWLVHVVPNFGESRCTLLVFRFHSLLTDGLCIPKLFSLLNDGALSFDTEPKLRGTVLPPYNIFVSVSYTLWTWCQMVTAGPLSLLVSSFRKPHKVWEDATKWHKSKSTSTKRYRNASVGSLPPSQKYQNQADSRRVTWARVPNVEQMMRAERILRSSTVELLLSFIAGALRRHFRSQGIRNPPNVQISLPVSCREFMPIGRHQPCRFLMVPLILPVSVEGNIPRVWEVQRLLAEALDGAFPQAVRAAASLGDLILPTGWCRSIIQKMHKGSSCLVTYLRLTGEPNLNNRKIHSMLMYPPAPDCVRSAFTFVQTGHEIVVSLAVDPGSFPDPDMVLASFQAELQSLLRQLALRMLTLSQATFLPAPLLAKLAQTTTVVARSPARQPPSENEVCDQNKEGLMSQLRVERNNNRSSCQKNWRPPVHTSVRPESFQTGAAAAELLAIDASDNVEEGEEEKSLEELERLMSTVQAELDSMRAHPRGNRSDYIAKLSELESKMEAFHRSITERLKENGHLLKRPSGTSSQALDLDVCVSVETLLRPYKDEAEALSEGMGGMRKDSGFKLRRKKSKRLDSPTRISPRPSRSWESENP